MEYDLGIDSQFCDDGDDGPTPEDAKVLVDEIMKYNSVSRDCAEAILYGRAQDWFTPEMEDRLVELDHNDKPLPDLTDGKPRGW